MRVHLVVPGRARSKGSWSPIVNKRTGKVMLIPRHGTSTTYQKAVARAAKEAGLRGEYPGPVRVEVDFFHDRPKKDCVPAGWPKRGAPEHLLKAPDVDKVLRAVLDGLTGTAFMDDAQVVVCVARKLWTCVRGAQTERTEIAVEYLAAWRSDG